MENTDRQYQKLAAQMQNISDEGWTQLSNFMRDMHPVARKSLHDLVYPNKISDEEFMGAIEVHPEIISIIRRFARQSYTEVINRHFNGETVGNLEDIIDTEGNEDKKEDYPF